MSVQAGLTNGGFQAADLQNFTLPTSSRNGPCLTVYRDGSKRASMTGNGDIKLCQTRRTRRSLIHGVGRDAGLNGKTRRNRCQSKDQLNTSIAAPLGRRALSSSLDPECDQFAELFLCARNRSAVTSRVPTPADEAVFRHMLVEGL